MSKEITRIYYRKTSWYKDIELAKEKDKLNWKTLVKSPPFFLSKELALSISLIYKIDTNELTKRK